MKQYIFRGGVVALLSVASALPASAQVIDLRNKTPRNTPPAQETPQEQFIAFAPNPSTHIDAGSLGAPFQVTDENGLPTPDDKQALIRLSSSSGIRLTIQGSDGLKNERTQQVLPTWLDMRVQGPRVLLENTLSQENIESVGELSTDYFSSPSNDTTTVSFITLPGDPPPQPGVFEKAIALRVRVKRSGMNDTAGIYSARWVLQWGQL